MNNKIKINNLYITLAGFNKFTKDIVDAKIKKEKSATKEVITDFVKNTDFDNKLKN